MSFLSTAAKGDYITFICVSVTNTLPHQLFITKVKQFGGSSSFIKRSQWTVEQLRQVNGINANKDSPEFDLVFDNAFDQWVARSSAEKCVFIQILYHACQTYWEEKAGSLGKPVKLVKVGQQGRASQCAHPDVGAGPSDSSASRPVKSRQKSHIPPRQTEFINCQSKLTGDASTMNLVIYRCKIFLNRMKNRIVANQSRSPGRVKATTKGTLKSGVDYRSLLHSQGPTRHRVAGGTLGNVAQRVNVTLGERGDRLTHAEDKTVELMHKAQQFADTAHKLALKYSK